MRRTYAILFLILVTAISQEAISQTYFSFTSNTGNNASISLPASITPAIDGQSLSLGDEIGAFTPDGLCVGAVVWTGENNVITVWGNNEITDVIDGIQPGEEIGFRVWRKSTNSVFNYVEKVFSKGTGLYAVNGMYVISLFNAVPTLSGPVLSTPANNTTGIEINVTLSWNPANPADSYTVRVSKNQNMSSPVINQSGITTTSFDISGLEYSTRYYWQVGAVNEAGISNWSFTYNFTTAVMIASTNISLQPGWNMISSRVKPVQTDIQTLFSEIESDVVLVKNCDGKTYWPGQGVNHIGEWNYKSGYQVYMLTDRELTLTGTPGVASENEIQLPTGWSLVAYLSDISIDPVIALESLGSDIVMVKNNSGGVYWPEFDLNTMGTMNPGQGYRLFLQNPSTLVYPDTGSINQTNEAITMLANHPDRFSFPFNPTGLNATILLFSSSSDDGDEVGVYTDDGELLGSGIFHSGKALLTVWGRDEINTIGAMPGEKLSLNYYSATDDREEPMLVESVRDVATGETMPEGLLYSHNGIFLVNGYVSTSTDIRNLAPDEYTLAQNYPNPFNPSTTISFSLPEGSYTTLKVYNTLGVEIATLIDDQLTAGNYSQRWEAAGVASGLYFYQLRSGSYMETRSMLLMK